MASTDVNAAEDPFAFVVLLHPHPHFGGDRFHPFIDNLFRRLPGIGVSALRFDFSSGETKTAGAEVRAAIDTGAARWPSLPAILCGYSFGAGIAATIDDDRVSGWYLLAAPLVMLEEAAIKHDPRPKALVVPEHDQFSPVESVEAELGDWQAARFATVQGADHFLGAVEPFVDDALTWIGQLTAR